MGSPVDLEGVKSLYVVVHVERRTPTLFPIHPQFIRSKKQGPNLLSLQGSSSLGVTGRNIEWLFASEITERPEWRDESRKDRSGGFIYKLEFKNRVPDENSLGLALSVNWRLLVGTGFVTYRVQLAKRTPTMCRFRTSGEGERTLLPKILGSSSGVKTTL